MLGKAVALGVDAHSNSVSAQARQRSQPGTQPNRARAIGPAPETMT
jgi:hypothetical protein